MNSTVFPGQGGPPSPGQGGPNSQRRSANYKPNIWKNEFIQSLASKYDESRFKTWAEKLREEVILVFEETKSRLATMELVDNIQKLGLACLFEKEIEKALYSIASSRSNISSDMTFEELYAVALEFKLLRQHGYEVSQDMFSSFVDEMGSFRKKKCMDVKGLIELFEASDLAFEGENILDEAKAFTKETLKTMNSTSDLVAHVMEMPSHKRVPWFNVKWSINMYEKDKNKNTTLLKLAKLNFNMVQASLQQDLREISRWWAELGLIENLNFARDRLVESFSCSVGLVFEPQHKFFRKWLTKVIIFILVIDDIYDVYGSLEELKQFTKAIDRWESNEVQQLPQCMRLCFDALHKTVNETAYEIQRENAWDHVLPLLRKGWTDFCKALLAEAEWYTKKHSPSLQEYLEIARISSSGALISIHLFFSAIRKSDTLEFTEETIGFLEKTRIQDFIRDLSLIIRLSNDLGTSKAEQERGDAPSSIVCYQREVGVKEDKAAEHIRGMIEKSWKRLNKHCFSETHPTIQEFFNVSMNAARVALSLYQYEDGFGLQDRDTRRKIMSSLIEPFYVE